ncbi:MAG: DUF5667 domain-containing protein [Anaerolineae bacterium]|nr:DUF5667 domain-containing protein [Anaerolineae bacterium]
MTEDRYDSDALAHCLDAVLPADRSDIPQRDDDSLVNAAVRYATLPQPKMSPEAKDRIRAQVLEASRHQTYFVSARPRIVLAMRWVVAAGLVLVLLMVGLTRVAMASVPGDTLYPVKQVAERVELALATSHQAQASTHLKHAERRVQEVLKLLDRGRWSPDLIRMALDEMVAAAAAARADTSMPSSYRLQLEARTVQINTLLDSILVQAEQSELVSHEALAPLVAEVRRTQASGSLLLPPSLTPSMLPVPTMTPSVTASPSYTPPSTVTSTATLAATEGPQVTETATPTLTLSPEETPGGLFTIMIEGSVQAIHNNIITIHDIEIEIAPDDPLLTVIQVGDVLQIEGEGTQRDEKLVIIAINIVLVDVEVFVSDDGQVWRDEGNCSNPPPAWAPAHGWRQRCADSGRHGDEDDND